MVPGERQFFEDRVQPFAFAPDEEDFDRARPDTTPATAPTTLPATEATPLATVVAPPMTALLTDLPAELAFEAADFVVADAGFVAAFEDAADFPDADAADFAPDFDFELALAVDAGLDLDVFEPFDAFADDAAAVAPVFPVFAGLLSFAAAAASFDRLAIASPAPVLAVIDFLEVVLPVSLMGFPSVLS